MPRQLNFVLPSGQRPSWSDKQSFSYYALAHHWDTQIQLASHVFFSSWAYWTSTKNETGFTPFQLVYGLEATLSIECEIPSLKLVVKLLLEASPHEEHLLYLEWLDKTRHLATLVIEAHKKRVKSHFDQSISPCAFSEGDLVWLYD